MKVPEVTTQSYQRLLPHRTRGYYPIIPQSYQRLLPNHTRGYYLIIQEVTTQSYQRLLPNHTRGYYPIIPEVTIQLDAEEKIKRDMELPNCKNDRDFKLYHKADWNRC